MSGLVLNMPNGTLAGVAYLVVILAGVLIIIGRIHR